MEKEIIKLFEIYFNNFTFEGALNYIDSQIEKGTKTIAFTPNADHIVRISRNKKFKEIYSSADLILNDSKVIYYSSKLLGSPLKAKISGSDLLPALCKIASNKNYKMFFLGGNYLKKSAFAASEKIKVLYPEIRISGIYAPPHGFEKDNDECEKIVNMINGKNPDILFVGLGTPKQEMWIYDYRDKLKAHFIIGIGASFDFLSGKVKRAPLWVQNMALEWLYRLVREPRRLWKRYTFSNIIYLSLFFKEFFRIRNSNI
jgi:N-acetylglucosaminyldiphosphoundecaprenol N-acetyl-beta-D-mannosaminyltransferase